MKKIRDDEEVEKKRLKKLLDAKNKKDEEKRLRRESYKNLEKDFNPVQRELIKTLKEQKKEKKNELGDLELDLEEDEDPKIEGEKMSYSKRLDHQIKIRELKNNIKGLNQQIEHVFTIHMEENQPRDRADSNFSTSSKVSTKQRKRPSMAGQSQVAPKASKTLQNPESCRNEITFSEMKNLTMFSTETGGLPLSNTSSDAITSNHSEFEFNDFTYDDINCSLTPTTVDTYSGLFSSSHDSATTESENENTHILAYNLGIIFCPDTYL